MTNANELIHSFPSTQTSEGFYGGLTKREYFAAMAMQGIVSNHHMIDTDNWYWLSKESVKAADALIKALNETE